MKDPEPEEKRILLIESMRFASDLAMRLAHGSYRTGGRKQRPALTEAAPPGYVQNSPWWRL
jgi:hypothetical protein